MKKIYFLALLFSIFQFSFLQGQATRHFVILEIATGTWCTYCPGAAMGADDLVASGANVAVVEHHNGDSYTTTESDYRNDTYYGVTGFPTAWFDGQNAIVGGSHSTSMYPSYNSAYNTAMAAPTPFDITGSWVQNGASIDVTINIQQVGAYSAGNLRMQAVLTESHLQVNWQGMTEVSFVNRDMYPDANGTPINITQGNTVTQSFNLPINAAWDQSEMQLVVWLENSSTKVIYNGYMSPLAVAANAIDPTLNSVVNEMPAASCATSIAPEVKIRNMGSANLTSVDFSYNVNGGPASTYTWTGNLPFLGYADVTLPSISFTPVASNTLTVNITNSNDAVTSNNTGTLNWSLAPTHPNGTYVVHIQPDNYGSETTWNVKNGSGTILASGGPYTDGNTTPVNVNVTIPSGDCFTMTVNDSYGDGMCCSFGNGSFSLTAPGGGIVFSGGTFGSSTSGEWKTEGATSVPSELQDAIAVYPNPSSGLFQVELSQAYSMGAEITVSNPNGQVVFHSISQSQTIQVDLSELSSGIFFMEIATPDGVVIKKLTKE